MCSSAVCLSLDDDLSALEAELDATIAARTTDRIREELSAGTWIYGAGNYGRRIAELMDEQSLPCLGFIDRRANILGESVAGLPVVHPAEFTATQAENSTFVLGILSNTDTHAVPAFARSLRFRHVILNPDLPDALGPRADNYWQCSRSFLKENFDHVRTVARMLADTTSVKTLLQLLRFRISGDPCHHPPYDINERYLPQDLPGFRDPIIFVDGGAYDGDTYHHLTMRGVDVKHWLAFEPDTGNFHKLADSAAKAKCQSTLFPCGLADRLHQVWFSNDGTTVSSIIPEYVPGATQINCVSLDEVIFGHAVDYVKLDIEGAEVAALTGMSGTIMRTTPRLAISAYHKPQDVWEIPFKIKELLCEYRLYLRQHDVNGFETVVYALPSDS